jgi:hypothetical protein
MNNILKDKTHRDEAWPQESLKLESKEKNSNQYKIEGPFYLQFSP